MLKEEKIPHVQGCLENEKRINDLDAKVTKWPINMDTIQFYAEQFENSNQFHFDHQTEIIKIKKELTLIKQSFNELLECVKNQTE